MLKYKEAKEIAKRCLAINPNNNEAIQVYFLANDFLNQDGIILVHDCLPTSISKQAVPRYRMSWNGDVWKAIVDLRQDENLKIYTLEIDQGIGVIKKIKNQNKLSLNKPVNSLKFKDFYYNYNEYMNLINLDMFKKIKF